MNALLCCSICNYVYTCLCLWFFVVFSVVVLYFFMVVDIVAVAILCLVISQGFFFFGVFLRKNVVYLV